MKRLLVIDALNMYFRAYIVDPSLSTNGQPIGGVKGFLKILQKGLTQGLQGGPKADKVKQGYKKSF